MAKARKKKMSENVESVENVETTETTEQKDRGIPDREQATTSTGEVAPASEKAQFHEGRRDGSRDWSDDVFDEESTTESEEGEGESLDTVEEEVEPPPYEQLTTGSTEERPVVYKKVKAVACVGDGAITVPQAKDLLGWETEEDYRNRLMREDPHGKAPDVKFGSNYLLTDVQGNKVRCKHNIKNRPLYSQVYNKLKQEHLMRRWRFNGEPIIIGKTKLVLNGQHTLISLILAEQERVGDNKEHWRDFWETPVTMEKLVVFGVDESDAVVNTMDTCKPRSLADVIYRSEYFAHMGAKDRKTVSRILDHAIKMLWARTGASSTDAFTVQKTMSEYLDFVARFPRILECASTIMSENRAIKTPARDDEKKGSGSTIYSIGRYYSPGYAAGLLYLMGSSNSDGEVFHKARVDGNAKEDLLNWNNWTPAREFWISLSLGLGGPLTETCYALGALHEASIPEKTAVICKSWQVWLENWGKTDKDGVRIGPSQSDLTLHYDTKDDGTKIFNDDSSIGGIDLGNPEKKKKAEASSDEGVPTEDNPETLEEEKLKERRRAEIKEALAENRAKMKEEKAKAKNAEPKFGMPAKETVGEQVKQVPETPVEETGVPTEPKPKRGRKPTSRGVR